METVEAPALVLDCRGTSCPLPVIRTATAIEQIEPGQVLLLLSTDPGTEPDLRAWSSRTGHPLEELRREGDEYQVRLRRRA